MGPFWRKTHERVVHTLKKCVSNCYYGSGHFLTASVLLIIYEVTYTNIFTKKTKTKYVIKEHVPLIKDPFFDGEYATNKKLNAVLIELQGEAQIWISNNS